MPIAQVIGDCLEKLCTCEFRQCALERLVTELCEEPDLALAVNLFTGGEWQFLFDDGAQPQPT